eukprot:4908265-Pleurochrysis_carterae.AAC.2
MLPGYAQKYLRRQHSRQLSCQDCAELVPKVERADTTNQSKSANMETAGIVRSPKSGQTGVLTARLYKYSDTWEAVT